MTDENEQREPSPQSSGGAHEGTESRGYEVSQPQAAPFDQSSNGNNPYASPAATQTPEERPMNTLAIVGFVLSFITGFVGAIISHVSLSKIKKTGERGRGLAIAGAIIGWVVTAGYIVTAIVVIAFLAFVADAAQKAIDQSSQGADSSTSQPQKSGSDEAGGQQTEQSQAGSEQSQGGTAQNGKQPPEAFCDVVLDSITQLRDINQANPDPQFYKEFFSKLAKTRGDHQNQKLYEKMAQLSQNPSDPGNVAEMAQLTAPLTKALESDGRLCGQALVQ